MLDYTEDSLVEHPAISLFAELRWETANCYNEKFGEQGDLGRETPTEILLFSRLAPALERLNLDLPAEAFQYAIEELKGHYLGSLLWEDVCNTVNIPYNSLPDTVPDWLSERADLVMPIY